MVRSAAISWTIGLTVTASALQVAPLPALADDGSAQEIETRAAPLEPKAVPVTLLPPASDTAVSSWRPWPVEGAPIIMVRPAKNAAIPQPAPEQVDAAPIAVQPAESAASVQPAPGKVEGTPLIMMRPAGDAAIAQPRAGQVEAATIIAKSVESTAVVQPRQEPQKVRQDHTPIEPPSASEPRPRVALLPPVSDATTAEPRPEPAKAQKAAPSVAIPSLPGRSPFRQAPFKSEIVENPQQSPGAAPAKGNAASRFLANLWPGNKGASTPVGSTNGGSPSSAGEGKAGQAEASQQTDKPPIKRLLDGIQFWKN